MGARTTCKHGITPKYICRKCTNETARISAKKHYDPEKARLKYLTQQAQQRVSNMNSHAKKIGVEGTITVRYYHEAMRKGCAYCGSTTFPLELDHRIPMSKGGTNWPENVQAVCQFCNRSKHSFSEEAFLQWLNYVRKAA
jgi:5-methylcytosine-specific restriction endonuclease McrA